MTSTYKFGVNLLRLIDKFVSPNLISFDQPKIVETYQRFFEPFAVEIDDNTFKVIYENLAGIFKLETQNSSELKFVLFRILASNLNKWSQSFASKNRLSFDGKDFSIHYRLELYELCFNTFSGILLSSNLDLQVFMYFLILNI